MQPGDTIEYHDTSFTITEMVDGHIWGNEHGGTIKYEHCSICMMIRRADKMNNPCKGGATMRPPLDWNGTTIL